MPCMQNTVYLSLMKSEKNKILRQKGIEICANLLYAGQSRKEIIKEITEKHKACESTIDQWIKAARTIVQARQQQDEAIRLRVSQEEIQASAKRLNLSRERILEEYAKIAFFDIRTIFTEDGSLKAMADLSDEAAGAIAGIETFEEKDNDPEGITQGKNRKIKIVDKRGALDSICRVLGYNAAEKREIKADISLSELPIEFD